MDMQGLPTSFEVVTRNPMQVVRRYVFALLGGFLAMGAHMYLSFRSDGLFVPGRISTTVAAGLFFGGVVGFMVLVASEYPQRLKSVWSLPARLALALGGGTLLGTLVWFAHHYLILLIPEPDWGVFLFGGLGLSVGFALHGIWGHLLVTPLQRLGWLLVTAVCIYAPVYITYQNFLGAVNSPDVVSSLIYYSPDRDWMLFGIGVPFALVIAIGGYLPLLWRRNERKKHE
jgi:hypothetical protein